MTLSVAVGFGVVPLSYLDDLNPPQRQAVETLDRPLLVLSGAGTGKTKVLTTRIAHILAQRQAFASQILAVTFTNRAAQEMRERVTHMVGGISEGLWLGTFHSLAAKMLRVYAERVGLKPNFTILDTDDQLRLIKQLLKAEGIDEKKSPARAVLGLISRWKDRGLTPDKVGRAEPGYHDTLQNLYGRYQQRLLELNAVDFGDLLLHCLCLFRDHPDVLARYNQQFRFILVDEYQDTNVAQYLWLRLLAQGGANLCCVGDDDQSIYGWRGAEVGNILRFERDFPEAIVIRLEQNYRSTEHILATASVLISHNKGRLGKTLWTERQGGEKVKVSGVWSGEEEARYVGEEVEHYQRHGSPLSSMAILVRAGFQTREFEDRFIALGIPYRVIGGARFYERQEIRDALAYLRLIAQSSDNLAFERIINVPKRGVGPATLQTLNHVARKEGVSLVEATRWILQTEDLKGGVRTALSTFIESLDRWQVMAEISTPSELARVVLDDAGYTAMWQADTSPEAPGRLENLKEFVTALTEFDSLQGFLEHVSLVMENNTTVGEDMISIMTLHSAKGLEFDTVFLCGWEEGLFPHPRSLEESGLAGLEEERRLAYVGLTRAKAQAIITFAGNRRIHNLWQSNLPSRFLDDLPRSHIEIVNNGMGSWGRKENYPPSFVDGRARISDVQSGGAAVLREEASFFEEGERVFHIKFGYGIVLATEGGNLTIDFEHSGPKKVLASFVEKA